MMIGMGGMWFGWLVWIALIGLIIWGVRSVFESQREQRALPINNEDALELLKKRYAQGEISDDEFERKRKHL